MCDLQIYGGGPDSHLHMASCQLSITCGRIGDTLKLGFVSLQV
jgi:hypothetical protein